MEKLSERELPENCGAPIICPFYQRVTSLISELSLKDFLALEKEFMVVKILREENEQGIEICMAENEAYCAVLIGSLALVVAARRIYFETSLHITDN